MRIVCPNCQATYDVPDMLVAGGKAVRCVRCVTEWTPAPAAAPPPEASPEPPQPAPGPDPEPAADPPLHAEPRLAAYRPRSVDSADDARPPPRDDEIDLVPRRRTILIAWAISILILALLAWAAFAFRGVVMGAWPPSTRLYAMLGLR